MKWKAGTLGLPVCEMGVLGSTSCGLFCVLALQRGQGQNELSAWWVEARLLTRVASGVGRASRL